MYFFCLSRRLFSIHMNPKNDPEITEFKQKQNPKLTTQNRFLQKETDTFILKLQAITQQLRARPIARIVNS